MIDKYTMANEQGRKRIIYGLVIFTILIISIFVGAAVLNSDKDKYCVNHNKLAQHKHATLSLYCDDEEIPIPTNIGIAKYGMFNRECMAELHTHDDSGTIHIESPKQNKWFSIGDFMVEWSREDNYQDIFNINRTCLRNTPTVIVNGVDNALLGQYLFSDGDDVVVQWKS